MGLAMAGVAVGAGELVQFVVIAVSVWSVTAVETLGLMGLLVEISVGGGRLLVGIVVI